MFEYFNTTKGIINTISGLTSLHKVIDDRRKFRKDNPDKMLAEFVLMGWLILDKFGQVNIIDQVIQKGTLVDISKEICAQMPFAISMTEFKKLTTKLNVDHWQVTVNLDRNKIPFVTTQCPCCKKAWSIHTLRDSVTETDVFLAEEIQSHIPSDIRMEIAVELTALTQLTDAKMRANDVITRTLRRRTKANWTIITKDDKVHMYVRHDVYHRVCYQQVLHKTKCQEFEKVFRAVGINLFGQIRVKNEYGSESYNGPWFIFDTEYGPIKVGWRKRVIAVDYRAINRDYLVNSDETRGPGYEHVEGYEKLEASLRNFINYLKQNDLVQNPPNLVSFIRGEPLAMNGV